MNDLLRDVEMLRRTPVRKEVDNRIKSFKALNKEGNKEWFSELCFCILTANTSAELGIRIQKELGYDGFTRFKDEAALARRLKDARYRFYNRRAHFIALANQHKHLKNILNKVPDKREWLVKNIKGIGYKEASHFLRNVGFLDYAILDKHILNLMIDHKLIKERPKCWKKECYEDIEQKFREISKRAGMPVGELDLFMWYIKTGTVLK